MRGVESRHEPGPTAVALRRAVLADADSIAACHVACWREAYAGLLSPDFLARQDAREVAERWRDNLTNGGDTAVTLAENAGVVIGFATSRTSKPSVDDPTPGPPHTDLMALYVRAAFYGTGVGQRLFDAAVPPGPCQLWVAAANPRAHSFYRRQGMDLDGQRSTVPDWEDLPIVRMSR